MKTTLIITLLLALITVIAGAFIVRAMPSLDGVPNIQKERIPTPTEIQQLLIERGYNVGPDGADGKIGTKTLKAWDRAICDQYAAEYFKEPK